MLSFFICFVHFSSSFSCRPAIGIQNGFGYGERQRQPRLRTKMPPVLSRGDSVDRLALVLTGDEAPG